MRRSEHTWVRPRLRASSTARSSGWRSSSSSRRTRPGAGSVIVSLLATALAVALAELYSDVLGGETRARRKLERAEIRHIARDASAVAFGIGFPAVFFLFAVLGVYEDDTAFTLAKWSGLGLIGAYGYAAARLGGQSNAAALLKAFLVALVGAFLIAIKALLH